MVRGTDAPRLYFVTRLKDNTAYAVLGARHPVMQDELITLTGVREAAKCPYPLRVVEVTDPETGEPLVSGPLEVVTRTLRM